MLFAIKQNANVLHANVLRINERSRLSADDAIMLPSGHMTEILNRDWCCLLRWRHDDQGRYYITVPFWSKNLALPLTRAARWGVYRPPRLAYELLGAVKTTRRRLKALNEVIPMQSGYFLKNIKCRIKVRSNVKTDPFRLIGWPETAQAQTLSRSATERILKMSYK